MLEVNVVTNPRYSLSKVFYVLCDDHDVDVARVMGLPLCNRPVKDNSLDSFPKLLDEALLELAQGNLISVWQMLQALHNHPNKILSRKT